MADRKADDQWRDACTDFPLDHDGPLDVAFEPFDDSWLKESIANRFLQIVTHYGDKTAVVDEMTSLTYRELQRASWHLACRIQAIVPAGEPVGILLPNNALFPVAAIACLAIGRPYVPIDPQLPQMRIDDIRRDAGLAAMIINRIEGQVYKDAGSLPCFDIGTSLDDAEEQIPIFASPEGPGIILYTSGSTGQPKGICNDQRAIMQRVVQATNSCHLNACDRFFLLSSPGTIAGARETFAALLNGATLYVAEPTRLGINGILRMLREARATVGYAVPALLRQILAMPEAREALAHVRIIRIGGDIPVADDLTLCRSVLSPSCYILIAFSSTEVPTIFQWFIPRDWNPEGIRLPIGYARPGMSFKIKDNVATHTGELVVKSRYLALGYWQKGRLQPGPFRVDPKDSHSRILHTGDGVRLRPDGLVEMTGRIDRQVKVRGVRIDLAEIDAALRSCSSVADVAVIGRRRGEEVSALVAYVVPRDPPRPTLVAELKEALAERLPWRMRPAQYRILDALPRLRGFKTDFRTLEELDRCEATNTNVVAASDKVSDPSTAAAATHPNSRVHDAVARAWTTILGRGSFDANLTWDEAGGDSLGALHLWSLIEETLGNRLVMESLESSATPTALIAAVERQLFPVAQQTVSPTNISCSSAISLPSTETAEHGRRTPLVFFLPPADGDTPIQAQFRAAFHNQIRFKVVQYPQWRELIDAGVEFRVIVEATVAQILSTNVDDIYLAGFSFGGFVAWEASRRLIAYNRHVCFVGLIDTHPALQFSQRWRPKVIDIAHHFCRSPQSAAAMLLNFLAQRSAFRLLRRLGQLATCLPGKIGFKFYYHLNYRLRAEAMHRWKMTPTEAPVYLFRTDEFPADTAELSWGPLSKKLKIISVGSAHLSVLHSPGREILCRRFLQTINTVVRTNSRQPSSPQRARSKTRKSSLSITGEKTHFSFRKRPSGADANLKKGSR